jgi:hypothetical protein
LAAFTNSTSAPFTNNGNLAAVGAGGATGPFTNSGVLAAVGSPRVTPGFTSTGTLSATAVAIANAPFTSAGTLAAPGSPQAAAGFTNNGNLAAAGSPRGLAGFTNTGDLAASGAGRGTAAFTGSATVSATGAGAGNAAFTGSGSLSASGSSTSLSAMGMDKSGTMAIASDQTATVTGWTARSGYSATVITSNALMPDGGGSVTVQCKLTLSSAWFSGTALVVRVMKNGSQIASSTIPFNSASVTFSPISATLTNGDALTVQFTSPFGASGTINAGSTSTYLYYDLV